MHHHYARPPEYPEPMHWSEKLILAVFIAVLVWFGLCVVSAHSSSSRIGKKPSDATNHPTPAANAANIPVSVR